MDVVVRAEVRRLRPQKKHIAMSFWAGVIRDFNLCGTLADGLEPPPVQEAVAKELDVSLRIAHSANPAAKSCSRLVRFLEFTKELNATEYYGIIRGSLESPSMSRGMSATVLEAVLRYSARHRADQAHPQFWSQMRDCFDRLLLTLWQRAQARRLTRAQFLRAWRAEVGLFLDMEVASAVVLASEEAKEPHVKSVEALSAGSLIGAELFSPEVMLAELLHFKSDVTRRLYELEQQHFDAEELAGFREICQRHAESLDDELWSTLDCRSQEVPYLSGSLTAQALNPNDLWHNSKEARVRTLAISGMSVPRLPWERWLYGERPVPGCPTTIRVPEELTFDMVKCRDLLLKLLGNCSPLTLDACRRVVHQNSAELLKLDKSFWLDEMFLEVAYEGLIEAHLKECVLAVVPAPGEKRILSKAVTAGKMLLNGEVVTAQKVSLEKDLRGAVDLLEEIAEGRGPTASEAAKMGLWSTVFLKRCENFCVVEDDDKCEKTGAITRKTFFGGDALSRRYARCVGTQGVQDAADLKDFRSFAWMLSRDESRVVAEWQRHAVVTSSARLKESKAKALKDVEEAAKSSKTKTRPSITITAPPLKKQSLPSSSSSGSRVVVADQPEEVQIDDLEDETGLLSFC